MLIQFNLIAWLVGLVLLGLFWFILQGRGRKYLVFFSLFWLYLLVVASLTLFPIPLLEGSPFRSLREQVNFMLQVHALNLMPFNFDACWQLPRSCLNNIVGNILLTLPFGLMINFLAVVRVKDYLWLAFAPGFLIECMQFILDLAVGSAFRTVDVNDVLLNALGTWLGYGLFLGFVWFVRRFVNSKADLFGRYS